MVELENERVSFAAVNARVLPQESDQVLIVLLAKLLLSRPVGPSPCVSS